MGKKLKKNVPRLRFPEFRGDWKILTIEEIASVSSGGTPSRTEPSFWGGDIPWVTTREVGQPEIFDTTEKITPKGLENSSAKIFEKNTILMAMYGQGKTRGQVSILRIEATTNQACAAITLNDNYNPEFIYHFLSGEYEHLRLLSNDGSQKNLSAGLIKQYRIPLPAIAEQEKIANFLGAVDTRLNQLRRKREHLQTYKRGVMQKLFSQQIRFTQPDGSPFPPWEKKKLEDIVDSVSSGRSKAIKEVGDYPVYGSTGIIGKSEMGDYSGEAILIARVGANAGKISHASGVYGVTDNTIIVKVKSPNNVYLLRTQLEIKRLNSMVFGSGQPLITGTQIKKLPIIFPSLPEEQEKIANFLTAIDRKIETLTRQIDQIEKFKKGLLQKLFV